MVTFLDGEACGLSRIRSNSKSLKVTVNDIGLVSKAHELVWSAHHNQGGQFGFEHQRQHFEHFGDQRHVIGDHEGDGALCDVLPRVALPQIQH